jgi:2-polyprenyl-3-methyl-5-hydroxy-6-metoxy-1,4-benzoquinol methylase
MSIRGRQQEKKETTNMQSGTKQRTITNTESPLSKSNSVRNVFENAPHYLGNRRVDIRVRTNAVKAFADMVAWQRLMDVGCGDGSVSLPLVGANSHATFLDLSSSMTERVGAKIPKRYAENVQVRNEDFMTAAFSTEFDLIVSVGVMAHVDSPEKFISKIVSLLRPGGHAIIEFTDCRHISGRLARFTSDLKEFMAPAKYRTNRLSFREVAGIFERQHLRLVSVFRYTTLPIPGVQRIANSEFQYDMIERVFGRVGRNRNQWLGNEHICLLTLDDVI